MHVGLTYKVCTDTSHSTAVNKVTLCSAAFAKVFRLSEMGAQNGTKRNV